MELRAAHASELPELLRLHRAAFGEEGAVIAKLVEDNFCFIRFGAIFGVALLGSGLGRKHGGFSASIC